jgi:hypothetical protein
MELGRDRELTAATCAEIAAMVVMGIRITALAAISMLRRLGKTPVQV